MYCGNCGERIPESSKFCLNCGAVVGDSEIGPTGDNVTVERKEENSNTGCSFKAFLLLCTPILLFAVLMFWASGLDDGSAEQTLAPTASSVSDVKEIVPPAEEDSEAIFNAERSAAIYYAKEMVTEQLSYPKTAKFGWSNQYGIKQEYRSVTNTVTCQNAFGVESEYKYVVVLILKDNPDEGYFPIFLMIGDEIYYDYRELINEHGEITDAAVE